MPDTRTASAALLASTLFFSGPLQAMTFQQYDKMSDDNQAEYVAALIQVAEKTLTDDSRSNDAAKVSKVFTTNDPGDKISIGMTEFMRNLALARVADVKRAAQNPSGERLEVEHAMIVTLKRNGIILPKSFMAAAKQLETRFPAPNATKK